MPWLLQPRIRLGCSINAAAHCRVDGGLKNEIVAGSFIVGCFFAIVVMNLIAQRRQLLYSSISQRSNNPKKKTGHINVAGAQLSFSCSRINYHLKMSLHSPRKPA